MAGYDAEAADGGTTPRSRRAGTGPQVYGWSVLAPLLWFGDIHEQFLTPVATAIIEFDQRRSGEWRIEGEEAVSPRPAPAGSGSP